MAKAPQRRTPRRVVNGVLFLDKPVGISSNNALQKARWLLNAAKGGHTGTLDPMASGLLPLTLGEATKFSQTLLDADKAYDATVLTSDGDVAAYYEEAAKGRDAKLTANWVLNDLLGRLGKDGLEIKDSPIAAADIAALVSLIEDGTISGKIARTVFEHMWAGEGAPSAIVEKHGLVQITDTGAIEAAVDALIAANPDKAAAVKDKPQAIGWFVGQVMKETGGKANPAAVNEILKAKLGL